MGELHQRSSAALVGLADTEKVTRALDESDNRASWWPVGVRWKQTFGHRARQCLRPDSRAGSRRSLDRCSARGWRSARAGIPRRPAVADACNGGSWLAAGTGGPLQAPGTVHAADRQRRGHKLGQGLRRHGRPTDPSDPSCSGGRRPSGVNSTLRWPAPFASRTKTEPVSRRDDINGAFLYGYQSQAGPMNPSLLLAYRAHKRLAKVLRPARAIRPDVDARAARHLQRVTELVQGVRP